MTVATRVPLVEMRGINVAFGGVHAVRDVSIDLYEGEVMGLVGGNGAGKSTLMRALSGAHRPDSGDILVRGEPASIANPRDAKTHGIETIYQTLALADNIDAPANMFLGREIMTRWGTLDESTMEDHEADQSELHELHDAGQVAVRWPTAGDRHRPSDPFQRPDPHHG